jgi:thymidylate synthase (FAD)
MIKVELQESMGSDAAIANAAWTSTYNRDLRDIRYDNPEVVADLVRRCARDGHSTPFESVIFRFWIRMPIFTDRQHMTHRIASHNGLSGRYRTVPTDFFEMPDDVSKIYEKAGLDVAMLNYTMSHVNAVYADKMDSLKQAKADGLVTNEEYKRAREITRNILPQANMVERTTIINLRSFANYMRLRTDAHAQPEIQEVARQMLAQVKAAEICPVALEAVEDAGWQI